MHNAQSQSLYYTHTSRNIIGTKCSQVPPVSQIFNPNRYIYAYMYVYENCVILNIAKTVHLFIYHKLRNMRKTNENLKTVREQKVLWNLFSPHCTLLYTYINYPTAFLAKILPLKI